ncbi:MAG: BACON domain-containing protein [Bacteroidales bacterium]|nr:BACON domain-containing protein [Bacteroidales bacterium]
MKTTRLCIVLSIITLLCVSSCVKDYSILLSSQDLRFGLASESQTLTINANCKWTITKNDDADWYTISPMSGKAKDSIVTVTVNDYSHGDFRGSSFVVNSPGSHIRRTVFVSQNKLDFDGLVNKVFGLTRLERWNTDYYGQIIEDEYDLDEYDPYDTTRGQRMYFLENGQGVQRRVRVIDDSVFYYSFEYNYNSDSNIFHIVFHLEDGSLEPYDPEVLCASDSLFRIFHEYKHNWWERADMRKVGTIALEEKKMLMRAVKRRKSGDGVFQF